jgi:TonB-linked SusC/RagA family outer membrane protein
MQITFNKPRRKVIALFVSLIFIVHGSLYGSLPNDAVQQQETFTVTGKVTAATTGEALPGVSIQLKGTVTGTITNIDGIYTLDVKAGDVLVFSYVGYLNEEITVSSETTIDVALVEDIIGLDELVVVGYGVQKKKLNTGASLNVKGEEIIARNTTTAMDALQGISPGVSITRNNGLPGSGSRVYIRGMGTIGNAEPLYIVDGIAVEDIDYLSPSDVESIDVLKDGATAAIYGSRAANGVILVTTKKGKSGKMQVTYDGWLGWSNPYKLPDLLNAQQYAEIMDSANANSGRAPHNFAALVPDWDRIQSGDWEGTDWLEEFRNPNAFSQSHAFGFTGGSERSSYSMGISYLTEEGIFGSDDVNSTFKRLNLRLNSEHILWKAKGRDILVFGENLTFTNRKNPTIRTGNIYWSDVHNMLVCSPFLPLYGDSASVQATPFPYHQSIRWDASQANPIANMELQSKWNWNNNNTIVANAYLDLQPIKNLHLRSSIGLNNWYGSSRQWQPAFNLSAVYNLDMDAVRQQMYSGYSWTFTNTVSYNFSLQNTHNFVVLIGTESVRTESDLSIQGYNRNSIFQDPEYAYLDNAQTIVPTWTEINGRDDYGWAMISYFGRLSYDYKEKYLLTGVIRRDGSSNFAKGNRFGIFPSVSAGWVITAEPFMEPVSEFLNYLKLRASWGQNGNENIDPFQYLASISYGSNEELHWGSTGWTEYYFFGYDKAASPSIGAYPPILPNPDVSWETSEQLNLGLDMYFLNNKLQFTFDLYKKDTRDWLVVAPALRTNGTGAPYINGGDVTNKGIELILGWNDHAGDFSYNLTGTFAYNKNEVVNINNDEKIIHGEPNVLSQGTGEMYRAEVGFPIGYFWGYKTDGIFQTQDEVDAWNSLGSAVADPDSPGDSLYFADLQPGDMKFVDTDGNGIIDDDDKVMIGDPNPDFIFGIQFNAEYKGIFVSLIGTGAAGHQIAKSYRSFGDSYRNNFTTEIFERWTGPGTSNTIPRVLATPHRNTSYVSDMYIQDADYFRISNLTIGYDLSRGIKIIPFEETRLYFSARNLVTFTKYDGMDPEVGYGPEDDPWASGIDLGLYPVARTFLVGLSIKF